MPRPPSRACALLLIPCLLADPVLGSFAVNPAVSSRCLASHSATEAVFEQNALMLMLGAGLFAAYQHGWTHHLPFLNVFHWLTHGGLMSKGVFLLGSLN